MATAIETARQQAAQLWDVPLADVLATDLSADFFWADEHTIVHVARFDDSGRHDLVIAITKDGDSLIFGDPDDLSMINRFFDRENIALPEGLPVHRFATAIRSFLAGPRGLVGSTTFFDGMAIPRIERWLEAPGDEDLFRRHCRDPLLEVRPDHWQLEFFFFTEHGGIELWRVTGRPDSIGDATVSDAVPAGTFRFPWVD